MSIAGFGLRLAILMRPLAVVDRLFVPDDTYYTLTIARSIARGHGPTVDGTTTTSGFQPLLGFLMTPVFWFTDNPDTALRVDLVFLVVVDTMTIAVLAWVAFRVAGPVAAIVAAAIWAMSPIAIAMSLGGLETSLAMFFEITLVAGWIWANDRPSTGRWTTVGVLGGFAVLARIDALALVALLTLVQLWRGPPRSLVPATVAGAFVLAPWWIFCAITLGTPFPTSGAAAFRIKPYGSYSSTALSFAAGAVSAGPFQPWNWARVRLFDSPGWGVLVFWLLVASLVAIAIGWLRHGWLAATLPAFAACLLLFYGWYSVTFYYTRYLAPVALTMALVIAVAAGRLWSALRADLGRTRKVLVAALVVGALAIPTVSAVATDGHNATDADEAGAGLPGPIGFDAATGYREGARQVAPVPPEGSVLGCWQSGAVGYFARDRLTVINLDGVVNPDAAARQGPRLAHYIRRRRIRWLADAPMAAVGLSLQVFALQPAPTARTVAKIRPAHGAPPYDVIEIVYPPGEER